VIFYTDENGRRRKKTGATDEAVSERIARDIENRVALRREGLAAASYSLRIVDLLLGTRLAQSTPREIILSPSEAPVPPRLTLFEDHLAPLDGPVPCVYFLVRDDVVVYVGQTTNLHLRVARHRRDKQFDRVLHLPTPCEDLDRVERGFIHALQPEYNLNGKEC
jgi:hypothetical protein